MNRRKMNWALPVALALLVCLSPYCLAAQSPSAKSLYQQGQLAEAKGDIITAYDDYAAGLRKGPERPSLQNRAGSHVLRGRLGACGIAAKSFSTREEMTPPP